MRAGATTFSEWARWAVRKAADQRTLADHRHGTHAHPFILKVCLSDDELARLDLHAQRLTGGDRSEFLRRACFAAAKSLRRATRRGTVAGHG